jgi:F-type H+-transporting ATPase subunit c
MIEINLVIHYVTIALIFALPALTIAIGQGLTAQKAMTALNTQPAAEAAIRKNFFLGTALNETAALISGLMVLLLIMGTHTISTNTVLAQLGIFLALALPCACVGILSTFPHQASIEATARQPFFAKQLLNLMFITISIMQTSVILGLIVSFLIQRQLTTLHSLSTGLQLLAGGMALGIGAVGPLIGLGLFSRAACTVIGTNRDIYPKVLTFTFISQALIETPILFSLAVSLLIITNNSMNSLAYLCAAAAIALSTLGAGIASGKVASSACAALGKQPQEYAAISRTSLLAQTLIDACPIYGLLIAFILLYFV